MIIRDACPADSDRLMAIEQHAPQGCGVQLQSERRHFFVRADRFSRTICLVAEDEHHQALLGVMCAALQPLICGGQPALGAMVFDWRANGQAASGLKRHMFELWQALRGQIQAAGADFIFGYVKADNERSLSLSRRIGAQVCDTVDCLLFPVRRPPLHVDLGVARIETAPAALTATVRREMLQDLFPLDTGPEDGNLKMKITAGRSSVKIYDASGDQQHRVLHVPAVYRLARPLLQPLRLLAALPHIPKTGNVVRGIFFTGLDLADSRDWPVLLESARRLAKHEGADTLSLFLSRKDPDYPLLARHSRYRLPYHLVCLPLASSHLPASPTHFDIRNL